jgi:serine O-acetyltransferase
MVTEQQVLESLADVLDPELGANIVDLGFVKKVSISEKEIRIRMVLTIPGCPLAHFLLSNVRRKVEEVAEGRAVHVELSDEPWSPPWQQAASSP